MGKEGELWDDSALIKAFDTAISKYKTMHGMSGSTAAEKTINSTEQNIPAAEADSKKAEHVQKDDNLCAVLEAAAKDGDMINILPIKKNTPPELGSSAKSVGSSNVQNGNLPPSNENPAPVSSSSGKHVTSSDVKIQDGTTWYSKGTEEYNDLLNKYYELEDQRQKVLQQLNQYSNWNYPHPVSSSSTSEAYQACVPQPYNTATCYCSYGCQNWVVPCNSVAAPCSSNTCIDKSCNAIPEGSQNGNSISQGDPKFVKTAMVAAERALSSLTKEAKGGNDKQIGMEIGHLAESSNSTTGLDVVLNAWYSAGFYTGKYLSEQSLEKGKHSQGI